MNLIDKDALVAEIEKFEKALKNACKPDPFGNVEECMTAAELQALDVVKDTVNTLEVKEVDLESEIDKYLQPLAAWEIQEAPFSPMENIAKHFFELGIKARKGE